MAEMFARFLSINKDSFSNRIFAERYINVFVESFT